MTFRRMDMHRRFICALPSSSFVFASGGLFPPFLFPLTRAPLDGRASAVYNEDDA